MLGALADIAASFGFSASAGLNAYLTMLIVALAARFTSLIRLNPPFDGLTNGWVIGLLAVLTLVEALADKIPAFDTAYNVLQTLVRPVAGAVLFAASSKVIGNVHPVLALACGVVVAGVVHTAKTAARPVLTAVSGGTANPVVSTAEDIVAATTTIVSIVVPILALVMILIGAWLIFRVFQRVRADA